MENVISNLHWIILLTLLLSSQSLLITYSKNGGLYTYSTSSTIFFAEVVKFLVSGMSMWYNGDEMNFRLTTETLPFSIPALIYFVQNNLVFLALSYVDPTTYQVLVNLKILTTGILFRLVLGKELSNLQWAALVLLTVGCATSQISNDCTDKGLFVVPVQGIIICCVLALLSASAGIATEWLMKKSSLKSEPLNLQNMHLYFFGMVFCGFFVWAEQKPSQNIFTGYNVTTILVILSYSFSGLIVSIIMKYADNMVKIYSVAVSMIVTMILSIFLFSHTPTTQLFFGIIIITVSILMYFDVLSPKSVIISAPVELQKIQVEDNKQR